MPAERHVGENSRGRPCSHTIAAMTLLAVPIFVGGQDDVDAALERAHEAAGQGARLIEWRVDALAEEAGGADVAIRLVREAPAPCIVTCRSAREGGAFEGIEHDRIALYEKLTSADVPPRYIDIEYTSISREPAWREMLHTLMARQNGRDMQTGVIVSVHDFEQRPANLVQRIHAMVEDPTCSVIKVVWRARSVRDNLEAFDLLAERRKPMIALCVSDPPEVALMSRALAPKFGGLLSFATLATGFETAPGQPTIQLLRERYRFDSIDRDTKVYGVIGWPVAHSLSPQLHNAGFAEVNENAVYLPLPVPPEWEHFKATLGALIDHPRLNFRGASVTLPHKHHLLRFVEERGGRVDDRCRAIGAANTLIVGSAGALICANTDAPAAVGALCDGMKITESELGRKTIAILGAGGVARAVVAGLSEIGSNLVIFNRDPARAEELAAAFHDRKTRSGGTSHVATGRIDGLSCACFDIIINCTPVGMLGGPDPNGLPLALDGAADRAIDETVTVFDTVYAPIETPLIKVAKQRGAKVVTGELMFIKQAAMQFEEWTGQEAPLQVFGNL